MLYCLPLLSKEYDTGVVHLIEVSYIFYHYSLRFDRGVVHVDVILVYNNCFRFYRGVVHVGVILYTITL